MTGGIPEHYLAKAAGKNGNLTIESDRPCRICGYNLRGLPVDGICPECGTSIRPAKGADDPLSVWPRHVIIRFVPGCWMCVISLIAAIGMYFTDSFAHWMPGVVPGVLCLMSIVWLAGVWMATPSMEQPAAAERGFTRRSILRNASRWMQLFWPAAALAMLLLEIVPTAKPATVELLTIAKTVSFFGGIVAVMVLSVLLGLLAEWVRDDVAEKAFNWTTWGMPFLSLLLWAMLPYASYRIAWALWGLWLICAGTFPWAVLSLSQSVSLAIVHSRERREQGHRRAQRQAVYDEEVAKNIPKYDATRSRLRNRESRGRHDRP